MPSRNLHAVKWVTQELQIVRPPTRKMAVVHARGDPDRVAHLVLPALFETVCTLRDALREEGREFAIGPLYARWPSMDRLPKEEWLCIWALPVPDDITWLPQSTPYVAIEIEVWVYGTVAQILHVGSPCATDPAMGLLQEFAARHEYEIAGPREELYLPRVRADAQDILIRYPVKKQTRGKMDPLVEHRKATSSSLALEEPGLLATH
jgi:hypothetical protein